MKRLDWQGSQREADALIGTMRSTSLSSLASSSSSAEARSTPATTPDPTSELAFGAATWGRALARDVLEPSISRLTTSSTSRPLAHAGDSTEKDEDDLAPLLGARELESLEMIHKGISELARTSPETLWRLAMDASRELARLNTADGGGGDGGGGGGGEHGRKVSELHGALDSLRAASVTGAGASGDLTDVEVLLRQRTISTPRGPAVLLHGGSDDCAPEKSDGDARKEANSAAAVAVEGQSGGQQQPLSPIAALLFTRWASSLRDQRESPLPCARRECLLKTVLRVLTVGI